MQESPESILTKAKILVGELSDATLNDLCSQEVQRMTEAVKTILKKLDPSNPIDSYILQSLPIALIESGEHLGTLSFLQNCIENGGYFDPRIIDAVVQSVSQERSQYIINNDIEAANLTKKVLYQLYDLILSHRDYKKIPEIYLTIGADEERNKDTMDAVELYSQALGLGSIESYMFLGDAYESKAMYDRSTSIFARAYEISGDLRFLHKLVHSLCKSGKRTDAYKRYIELQQKEPKAISSFIVYVGDIHNDDDLYELSQLINHYCIEGILEPSTVLTSLANSSSVYIASEIEKESQKIQSLNDVSLDVWTEENDSDYWGSISRKLYLMQTHIITLADSRYLRSYLDEMQKYTIDGNLRTQEMIRRFFIDSFSPYVLTSYRQCAIAITALSIKKEQGLDKEERESYRINIQALQNITPMELYESMRVHLVQISAIFSEHSFYEITRDVITPFIEACMRHEGEFDEGDDQSNQDAIQELKYELDEYDSYTPTTRKFYKEYIEFFDKKYGMFYRRQIQLLVRDNSYIPRSLRGEYDRVFIETGKNPDLTRNIVLSNMGVFLDFSDIALLFLLEKIIAGQNIIQGEETMEMLVSKYHLDTLIESDAILLAAMLYESGESYNDAMYYITSIPGILDIPQVLSMLMEWIRYMEDETEQGKVLEQLDYMAQSQYDAKDFFEHIEYITEDIDSSEDTSDSDTAYMLMTVANMKIIRGESSDEEIRILFSTAGAIGMSQGYLATGDILGEMGDYDASIQSFILSYLSQPDIISMRRLIGCLIEAARFDDAREYIDMALRENYSISGLIFAWHLYQGKNQEAIEQIVKIVQSEGQMDMTMPEGCMELLSETIQRVLTDTTSIVNIDGLKILASYLNTSLFTHPNEQNIVDFIFHMDCIQSLLDSYRGDGYLDILNSTMTILIPDTDLDNKQSLSDKPSALLHIHFIYLYNSLMKIHIKNQNKENAEVTRISFDMINEFLGYAILILQRFPENELYLRIWRSELNLFPTAQHLNARIHTMPETVQ